MVHIKRTIRFQFRKSGLVHRTDVFDSELGGTLHVSLPYVTHCGLNIPGGRGGWGYGPKKCPRCFPE